jgi:uncharacterized membrane protein HdeD (DUF308 family)
LGVAQLVFLLVGSDSLRRRWFVAAGLAVVLLTLGLAVLADASAWLTRICSVLLGLVFLLHGALVLLAAMGGGLAQAGRIDLLRGLALMVLAVLILGAPVGGSLAAALLLACGFAVDGGLRIFGGLLIRFQAWRGVVFWGAAEILLAVLLVLGWPVPHGQAIPFVVSLLLLYSGWVLLRLSLSLRALEPEAAILLLPLFGGRGWQDNAPVLLGDPGPAIPEHPLTLHVWTPVGSAEVTRRRPVVDRYAAAVDRHGVVSTGHIALEAGALYISHYPFEEVGLDERSFAHVLRATAENDVRGRFQPSLAVEVAEWCEPDARLTFRRYDQRRLRAYWASYRQDDTYNVSNRNCAICVVTALEAALEGRLATPRPWLRILRLFCNPDIWIAAMLRKHASSITWTPGSVLDYARALRNVTEPHESHPAERLRAALRLLVRGA